MLRDVAQLAARPVRDGEGAGPNPAIPTIILQDARISVILQDSFPHGVTAAHGSLEPLVLVRIQVGEPAGFNSVQEHCRNPIGYSVIIRTHDVQKGVKLPNPILSRAVRNKKDEFYTPYPIIEREMMSHAKELRNRSILCNCNDSMQSNFCRFFLRSFSSLHLRRLVCIAYGRSLASGHDERPYVLDIRGADDASAAMDDPRPYMTHPAESVERLEYDSPLLHEYVDNADIIATNPPFSLFRAYFAWLLGTGKDFCILGNLNAVCYKNIFPHFMSGGFHMGLTLHGGSVPFRFPDDYEVDDNAPVKIINGHPTMGISNIRWFTSLKNDDPPFLQLEKTYSADEYPRFDNYDAINIDKTRDIPKDYSGVMGVPITFIDRFNREQFELLGCSKRWLHDRVPVTPGMIYNDCALVKGKAKYVRLFIRNRTLRDGAGSTAAPI